MKGRVQGDIRSLDLEANRSKAAAEGSRRNPIGKSEWKEIDYALNTAERDQEKNLLLCSSTYGVSRPASEEMVNVTATTTPRRPLLPPPPKPPYRTPTNGLLLGWRRENDCCCSRLRFLGEFSSHSKEIKKGRRRGEGMICGEGNYLPNAMKKLFKRTLTRKGRHDEEERGGGYI